MFHHDMINPNCLQVIIYYFSDNKSWFFRINSRKAIYSAAILTIIVLEILICGVYLQSYKTEVVIFVNSSILTTAFQNLLILEVFPHYISFVCAAAGKFFVDRQQTRQRMSLSAKKFQKKITSLILIQVFSKWIFYVRKIVGNNWVCDQHRNYSRGCFWQMAKR